MLLVDTFTTTSWVFRVPVVEGEKDRETSPPGVDAETERVGWTPALTILLTSGGRNSEAEELDFTKNNVPETRAMRKEERRTMARAEKEAR